MDKYSREVMLSLTSKDYHKAVTKYLLTYDLENWKIFTDNYFKLTAYEGERIIDSITEKLDFHMIIDILSIASIIGQSISLSNDLIQRLSLLEINSFKKYITKRIEELLKSPFAEERRIGLLMAGYFGYEEFFENIEKMSNYDVLFEDAYFSLGLMNDPEIIKLLGTKFIHSSKNLIQRKAIAKILAQKGNPLAALWLFKSKGFDFDTPFTNSIYLSRELVWAGLYPSLFIDSKDDFLQPITLKMITGLSLILPYDIELLGELDFPLIIEKLITLFNEEPDIELIKILYTLQTTLKEIYHNLDPYSVNKSVRAKIVYAWNLIKIFPDSFAIEYINEYIENNLDILADEFLLSLRLIRNFNLKQFELPILDIAASNDLPANTEFEIISTLAQIGGEDSANYIIDKLTDRIDFEKRNNQNIKNEDWDSEFDYNDDFNDDMLEQVNKSLIEDLWSEINKDQNDVYYWNAIYALGNMKSEKTQQIIIEALNDYDPKIRLEAIKSIRKIKTNTPIIEDKLVTLALHEPFMSVQNEAYLALGEISSQAAVPMFLKVIFESIEDGTLELAGEIDSIYDNRWDAEETESSPSDNFANKDAKEIGATHKIPNRLSTSNKKIVDEDISRWIERLNIVSQKNLELREDFKESELDISLDSGYLAETPIADLYDEAEYYDKDEESKDEDNEWLTDLSDKFRKLFLVDSVIQSLKSTQAKIPVEEVKELIEHPVDEELYKDSLLILAKTEETFALNELQGLFDEQDYIRAREIVKTLLKNNADSLRQKIPNLEDSPDWILRELLIED
ncbi:MAG: HEAT repeat domain-containing protein [Candidatus Heimdallarchaeota archaeon]